MGQSLLQNGLFQRGKVNPSAGVFAANQQDLDLTGINNLPA
jgi:hypothetical protein